MISGPKVRITIPGWDGATGGAIAHAPNGPVVKVSMVGLQGPPGIQGIPGSGSGSNRTMVAGTNLSGHRVVRVSGDGIVSVADYSTPAHAVGLLGITTGAAVGGASVDVQTVGRMEEPTWSWVVGVAIFCGAAGSLTATIPGPGNWMRRVGVATSPTSIEIDFKSVEVIKL